MYNFIDEIGNRYGRWLVESRADFEHKNAHWNCLCDCGTRRVVSGHTLRRGKSTSCGCLNREISSKVCKNRATHGHYVGGQSSIHRSWSGAKNRCQNPRSSDYDSYGGRGITVCDRWKGPSGFINFLEDMGEKPSPKHSLDRTDVNGNYEPGNCRWATDTEQANNRRNKRIEQFSDCQIALEFFRRGLPVGECLSIS